MTRSFGWIRSAATAALLVFLLSPARGIGPQYFPDKCENLCENPSDFAGSLPKKPSGDGPRPSDWAVVTLNQIKANLGKMSPPSVGRALALVSTCMYDAASLFEKDVSAYGATRFKKVGLRYPEEKNEVIDGAAFYALKEIFGDYDSFSNVESALEQLNAELIDDVETFLEEVTGRAKKSVNSVLAKAVVRLGRGKWSKSVAFEVGALACEEVVEKFEEDGFDARGKPLEGTPLLTYTPTNAPQSSSGVTDCKAEIEDLNKWQPLCTPTTLRALADVGNPDCKVQKWLEPWAGAWHTFGIPAGKAEEGDLLINPLAEVYDEVFGGPPDINADADEWERQMMQVVEASENLDDANKLIAEHWADGPDSTAPPGTWYFITVNAIKEKKLNDFEAAKLLMLVGQALNDAGVGAWRVKLTFDSIRPLQMIQCGIRERTVASWRGPYQGVGPVDVATWQPYQLDTFKTPPFAGYVSGHSTFSGAASKILELYFGSDDYVGPKCQLFKEGESSFEKKIVKGKAGYVKGVTDVPNTGKGSVGYSPASDVTLCWETFSEASAQAGESRIYGGIHVVADDVDGGVLGKEAAKAVFLKGMDLFGGKTDVTSVF